MDKIDELIIGGTNDPTEHITMNWTNESPYVALVRKYHPKIKIIWANEIHHKLHATTAFFNSGFKNASVIIIDGAGTRTVEGNNYEIQLSEYQIVWY